MRAIVRILFAALLSGVPMPVPAALSVPVVTGQFTPVDRCTRPGAAAFRASLARAVRARDVEGIVALSTPAVRLDFGGGAGHAELRKRLSGSEGAKLWHELDVILSLGCAISETGNLVIPGVFERDFGDLDPFDFMVVTGALVPLRAAPSPTGRVLRRLSWTTVEPVGGDDFEKPFRQVKLPGGKIVGYVESARLRSPLDYRLVASRTRGPWKIDAFLAGD